MKEKKKKTNNNRTFSTMDEVEKEFLPKYHLKQVAQKASSDIKYGEKLADILLVKNNS